MTSKEPSQAIPNSYQIRRIENLLPSDYLLHHKHQKRLFFYSQQQSISSASVGIRGRDASPCIKAHTDSLAENGYDNMISLVYTATKITTTEVVIGITLPTKLQSPPLRSQMGAPKETQQHSNWVRQTGFLNMECFSRYSPPFADYKTSCSWIFSILS